MSRTIPRAYVTAAWHDDPTIAKDQARAYCRILSTAGYLPLCPLLAFDGVIPADDPDGPKKLREMSEDLLRRARFVVVCGSEKDGAVLQDISIAKKAKVIPTTLSGIVDTIL